jgi:hypothetical protein
MFETQVDFAQVHLLDPTTGAEILDSTQWSGYSEPLVPSIPDSFLLEPTIITETSDFSLDNNSNLIATDPLTGDSLTNTFLLPVVDDTLTTAQDLGTIEGTQTVSDSVGIDDLNDYYRINLNTEGDLNVSLDGLTADADLELIADYNSDGFADFSEVIDFSYQWGTFSDNISANLPAGTYFINVIQYSGSTPYTLTVSATPTTVVESVSDFDSTQGYGLINASDAVSRAIGSPVSFADVPDTDHPNWGLNTINVPEVWSQGFTGEGVVVAVLDTGVDYTHPDLDGRIWQNIDEIPNNGIDDDGNGYADDVIGWDFIYNDADPMDFFNHGTHVAGIIAAEANEFGVTGVAPNAQIMPVQVITDYLGGVESVASGIYYAVNNGADVINMSLGFEDSFYNDLTPLQEAVQFATENGVVVVSSSGNDYGLSPTYPAQYATDWGIAVGASDFYNSVADFSNDAGFTPLDYVVAPGAGIYSTTANNNYDYFYGTSMAAPHVAGVAALMLSANPNLTVAEVEQILTETANDSVLIA